MKNLTREERQRGRWLAFYSSKATNSTKLKLQIGGERVLQRLVGKFFFFNFNKNQNYCFIFSTGHLGYQAIRVDMAEWLLLKTFPEI